MTPSPRTAGHHQYELTNHLGNVSVIVSDNKLLSANQSQKLYLPDVLEYQDYYPFGMVMNDRKGSYTTQDYRYGYNGKENDNEVKGESNQQDYGFRVYDPRVGRFLSVDPLKDQFSGWSPYNYTMNSPINMIDPDGRAPENIGVDRNGNVVYDDGKNDGNLFLVKDGAGKLYNSDDLQKNSTQLAKDNVWVANEKQLVEYVQSQWERAGNGMSSLVHVLDIKITNNKNGFAIGAFVGKKDASGNILINAKPLGDINFLIQYKKGEENHHLSNPYNTRNALGHEKQHIKQGVSHYHQEKGWVID
ncbi:MAG: RHS repeat-associated core domain-containing protein [Saprospiraceae bacterium]|nr:RHS repeat-associated core domain-containing protein [Saprospiraceae bacterium]